MVKNIIYIVVLAVIGIPSWQIGTVMLEKKKVGYTLQEQANSIKRYQRPDLVKEHVKENLEIMGLPAKFSFETLGAQGSENRLSILWSRHNFWFYLL